jgi:hypothetical protein
MNILGVPHHEEQTMAGNTSHVEIVDAVPKQLTDLADFIYVHGSYPTSTMYLVLPKISLHPRRIRVFAKSQDVVVHTYQPSSDAIEGNISVVIAGHAIEYVSDSSDNTWKVC